MMKHWMIAGLMGATVLTGIAPSVATAAEQDRTERRWEGRREARERGDTIRPERQAPQMRTERQQNRVEAAREARQERGNAWREARENRVEAAREARQVRAAPVRTAQQDWRQHDRDDRREWRQDRRDDRREWRQDRRDDRREWRQDARRDWERDRRDWRNDSRDWRDNRRWDYRNADRRYSWDRDWRRDQRYDWQRYRQTHRHIYRGPRYYAPHGWDYGYRRFSIGISLWSGLYSDRYWISDPWYYRLPPAYGPLRWIRYYDDALLVDIRTGYVVDVIHDFFW
jgi:hypothetical protein